MNLVDLYCLELFPEILSKYSKKDLEAASIFGSYIFHEDFFVPFIAGKNSSTEQLARAGAYIEYLSGNENRYLRNLAEIGILSSLIDRGFVEIVPHLGSHAKRLIEQISSRMTFDREIWI